MWHFVLCLYMLGVCVSVYVRSSFVFILLTLCIICVNVDIIGCMINYVYIYFRMTFCLLNIFMLTHWSCGKFQNAIIDTNKGHSVFEHYKTCLHQTVSRLLLHAFSRNTLTMFAVLFSWTQHLCVRPRLILFTHPAADGRELYPGFSFCLTVFWHPTESQIESADLPATWETFAAFPNWRYDRSGSNCEFNEGLRAKRVTYLSGTA